MSSQKRNRAIYYIGAFPPTYGGVTIKNKNLYHELSKSIDICRIDLNRVKHGDLKEIIRFAGAMLTGKQYIIGVSSQKKRHLFTKFLYWFKRNAMRRSILMVMGGIVDDVIDAGPAFVSKFNMYRKTYVELPGMLEKLEAAGVCNVAVYPNGRPRPDALPSPVAAGKSLNCVFFSIIQPEKGVDLILDAAKILPQMQFHFYGEIRKDYVKDFLTSIKSMENTTYHGVFTGDSNAVYRELSLYDVLLFPTRWKTEGLPGILIESKIAGLPAVVSDHNFNKEIVRHNHDGIVIQKITAGKIVSTLEELDKDREKLLNMKKDCKISAEQYYIEICAQDIVSCIQER